MNLLTRSFAIVVAGASGVLAQPPAQTPAQPPAISTHEWREDLKYLIEELPKRHPNPYFKVTQDQWSIAAAGVDAKIRSEPAGTIVVEFQKLVALIGDGHTSVRIGAQSAVAPTKQLPVRFTWLSDGVYAAAVPKGQEALIGRRLSAIGVTPIDEATARLGTVFASDTKTSQRLQVGSLLATYDVLAACGLASGGKIEYVFDGAPDRPLTLSAVSEPVAMAVFTDTTKVVPSRALTRVPNGCEVMGDRKTLYVWYDTCADAPGRTVAQFCEATLATLDEGLKATPPTIERVVIDLRRNGGGNSALLKPLITGLASREAVNRKGGLFVLIGRQTFSSALMNAHELRTRTRAMLVGETAGGALNHYGEVRTFVLPNSKLVVQHSTKFFTLVEGEGKSLEPDVRVEPDAAAFFAPGDVVLDRAIGWKE